MSKYEIPVGSIMGGLPVFGEGNHNEYGNPHDQYILKTPTLNFAMTGAGAKPSKGGLITYAKIYSLKITGNDIGAFGEFELRRIVNNGEQMIKVNCSLRATGDISNSNNVQAAIYIENATQLGSSNILGYLYDSGSYKVLDVYFKDYFRGINSSEYGVKSSGGRYTIHETYKYPVKSTQFAKIEDCYELSAAQFATATTGQTAVHTIMKSSAKKIVQVLIYSNSSNAWFIEKPLNYDYTFDTYNLGYPQLVNGVLTFIKRSNDTNDIYRRVVDEPETKVLSITPYIGNTSTPWLPVLDNYKTGSATTIGIKFFDLVNNVLITDSTPSAPLSFLLTLEIVP